MKRQVPGLGELLPKVEEAIQFILKGVCKRIDVTPNIKVYECKDVIRVDFKVKEEENEN